MFRLKTRLLSFFLILLLVSSVFWLGVNCQTAKTEVGQTNLDYVTVSPQFAANYTNVILFGWDGVQRNHLFELLNRGLMPNLRAFTQAGKLVNVTVSDHNTDTKAGWTQILTGYRWWKNGVFGNHVWFHSIPRGYTIPERLENIYGPNQIATAFITGKLNQMEIEDLTGSAAVGSIFADYSNQAIYDNLPSQLDFVSVGDLAQDRNADVVGPLMIQFIQNNTNNHFFGFFHLSDPDHIGHQYGENSIQYENAIETCDYWLGQLLNKLNALGLDQNTLIYITADHGFDEDANTHLNAPYIFLATNDNNIIRNGDEVDVAPTVYYGLGLWNYSFSPAIDGFPMQLNIPEAEALHRQATLADTDTIPTPSISITNSGLDQKTATFSATDNNLAAVFLVVDNALKTNGPWTWSSTGTITASGFYNINTTNLNTGLHSVKILAFDEHGANNGGIDRPTIGGWPSIAEADFYVGTEPTPSPTPFQTPSHSFSPSPTQTPTTQPSPTPLITFSPSPTQTPTTQPSTTPPLTANFQITTNVAFLIIAVVIVLAILAYLMKRRNG